MHLKSLTVRGFKSFASATTFDFEPGVTAVVGPNGSGKSNVVDALAWVMGEQGAKTLRGGKMEDVIFAGTAGRPPLGRAHVQLTIDNTDGALPIDYSEVTISRTLFRNGGSEYAINSAPCRLLDIQELLSDSGLGREMHVIVGQGQLDRVLHATPEDRRGFIEEAAGILKHRRRKERTVRKLDAMQANLQRLSDLTSEIRRQLTPLGKQAEVARRAQSVQFEVRDAKARLLADDLVQLSSVLAQEVADETALKERRAEVERRLTDARAAQNTLEQAAAQAAPQLGALRDTWYQLSAVREKFRSLAQLAQDRQRLLGSESGPSFGGRDPEQLQEQAARLRSEEQNLTTELEIRAAALSAAVENRAQAEANANAEEQRFTALLRAAADRREGLARLAGHLGSARSRMESAAAEVGRLHESLRAGEERRTKAQLDFAALESQVAGAEAGEEDLDAEYETAANELDALNEEGRQLAENSSAAEQQRAALAARLEALSLGLNRKDGTAALLEHGAAGLLGEVSASVKITSGHEAAIAAALGSIAGGLVVADAQAALTALEELKTDDAGTASLLIAGGSGAPGKAPDTATGKTSSKKSSGPLPAGANWANTVVSASSQAGQAVVALLENTVLVDSLEAAASVIAERPELTAVTPSGELLTASRAHGGSGAAPSLLETQSAADETQKQLAAIQADLERYRFSQASLTSRKTQAHDRADSALAKLHDSDAQFAAVAERLGQLNSQLRSAIGEQERLSASLETAQANLVREQAALEEATQRLDAAQEDPGTQDEEEPSAEQRAALAAQATAARAAEVEARLALRSGEEQLAGVSNRAQSLERAAVAERKAREEAQRRAQIRARSAARAGAVAQTAQGTIALVETSMDAAARRRDLAEEERAAREVELVAARAANENLVRELAELTDTVHKDELARAQQRLRIEALENRAIDELGISADQLIDQYGPDQNIESVDPEGETVSAPYVRSEQERRLKRAEKDLTSLGKVNPLALEEFAALEERHQFLASQLEDLKQSRKDLLEIIKEVDQRVQQVFAQAFEDTAEQFIHVFDRLFPGGEGRLILTDPDDLLNTGIEVEARPAGKKIKRLSLLSGGERSLTAVALLVAIFKARPSPFYVMDEVEAALDDVNLGRLITIFEELRESSQLIVITHQKRTMEVADALYGVTMRGDGVSTVISQRLEPR
ncbi:chromosome segregation protein SMC [Pseudarthrobacter sp. J1738]|uniref:chromosome segregation protein SMC n=1 Tax=Pseudarthrobacter sp. J1738 TaxID=3420446 RepID=UPI003D2A43DF